MDHHQILPPDPDGHKGPGSEPEVVEEINIPAARCRDGVHAQIRLLFAPALWAPPEKEGSYGAMAVAGGTLLCYHAGLTRDAARHAVLELITELELKDEA